MTKQRVIKVKIISYSTNKMLLNNIPNNILSLYDQADQLVGLFSGNQLFKQDIKLRKPRLN
jgi:hypothetical protein